jgi:hypothetical protein
MTMDKQQEFIKWLESQRAGETFAACKSEIEILLDLANTAMWTIHIRQRDLSHATNLQVAASLPKEVRDPMTMRFAITTRALRQMRTMGVIQ